MSRHDWHEGSKLLREVPQRVLVTPTDPLAQPLHAADEQHLLEQRDKVHKQVDREPQSPLRTVVLEDHGDAIDVGGE